MLFRSNAIIFQSSSSGALQLELGLLVGRRGIHQIEFGNGEVALGGQRLEARSCAQRLLLLHDVKRLVCQIARFFRCLHPGAALLKRILRVAYFDANLFLQLLQAQLGLTVLQLRTILVRLGDPITNREESGSDPQNNPGMNC